MKVLMVLSFLMLSFSSMGQVVNTGWSYHPAKCVAQTVCPNGRLITCSTVGFNYGNAPRTLNNMCRTRVVPGRFVHCQGFADQVDILGRLVFTPANYPVSCF